MVKIVNLIIQEEARNKFNVPSFLFWDCCPDLLCIGLRTDTRHGAGISKKPHSPRLSAGLSNGAEKWGSKTFLDITKSIYILNTTMPANNKSNSIHNLPFSKLYNWKIFEYRLREVKYLISNGFRTKIYLRKNILKVWNLFGISHVQFQSETETIQYNSSVFLSDSILRQMTWGQFIQFIRWRC